MQINDGVFAEPEPTYALEGLNLAELALLLEATRVAMTAIGFVDSALPGDFHKFQRLADAAQDDLLSLAKKLHALANRAKDANPRNHG